MQTSSRLSISFSALTLSALGIIAACSDDGIPYNTTDDGGSTFADAESPNPPDTNAEDEDAAVPACAAIDNRTDLAVPCRSCMAASCCAQANRCASNSGCQKVIDCVENCARGASPDGSVPDDVDEGDADEGDADEGDAGELGLDDGGVTAGELDPAEVQACIEACVAPLDEELEALEELNDCQAIYCPAECPSE